MKSTNILLAFILFFAVNVQAQSYEVQVYSAPTLETGVTMVELHSNFTINGSKTIDQYGMLPTQHVFHETIELTHGFAPWFETGFYIFTSIGSDGRTNYVGSHIRPRFAIPESFHWPVGLSLSLEYGWQKRAFSPDVETIEIRPIIDKKFLHDRLYVAFNPVFDHSFKGPSRVQGYVFSPNVKVGYDVTKKLNLGIEYYGTLGPIHEFLPYDQQAQQLFAVTDIDFGPSWEFNAGIGYGLSPGSDKLIVKTIIGRRFGNGRSNEKALPKNVLESIPEKSPEKGSDK